jgi:hypothetical protein
MRCCKNGCTRDAKLQLGWRCWPVGIPKALAIPIECWSNGAVCKKHIPTSPAEFLPALETKRLNDFLVDKAKKSPLDFDAGEVMVRELKTNNPIAEVMRPVKPGDLKVSMQ